MLFVATHPLTHPSACHAAAADKLSREAERLKERAQGLLHRRRYMEARVSEARQLQPGSGVAAAGQPAEGQEQRQQQQQQQQQQQAMQVEQRQEEPPDRQAAGSNGFTAAAAGIGPPAAAAATGTSTDTAAAEPGTAAAGPSAEAGPSAAYAELAGGMECPVCLTVVPAGGDINVFRWQSGGEGRAGARHAACEQGRAGRRLQPAGVAACRQAHRCFELRRPAPSFLLQRLRPRLLLRLHRQAGAVAGRVRRVQGQGDQDAGVSRGGRRRAAQRHVRPRV